MADDNQSVPPIPYREPMLSPDGKTISVPWGKWFRQVFARIGGSIAPSNTELAQALTGTFDNLNLAGNTISSIDTNGDINLNPNGSGKVKFPDLTASTVPYLDAAKGLVASTVTPTELQLLAGLGAAPISSALVDGNIIVGSALNVAASVNPSGDVDISNTGVFSISSGVIVDADVNASAAIAYSKLSLSNSIVNADIGAAAAIVYSKLSLALSIVNADISAAAAIAYSKLSLAASIVNADIAAAASIAVNKLAAVTAAKVLVSDGSGFISPSATTATEVLLLSGVTGVLTTNAGTQTLTNKTLTSPAITTPTGIVKGDVGLGNVDNTSDATKNAASVTLTNKTIDAASNTISNISNTEIKSTAAIAYSKLAALTSAHILVGSAGGVATDTAVTGDVTISNTGVTAIGAAKVTNAMLAGSITAANLVGSDITTVGTVATGTWSATTIALNKGGTGQTTKAAAFDALQPMTTSGDIIYGGASGTGTRLAKGSDGQVLKLASGIPSWATVSGSYVAPTVQTFTSGSGTYTTPANVLYIKVTMVGGGGGGSGSGTAAGTAATNGAASTFGTTLLSAGGGALGAWASIAGAGGTSSLGTGPIGIALTGGRGGSAGETSGTNPGLLCGGPGGNTFFGGGGAGGTANGGGSTSGSAGATNTGGGGGGGGTNNTANVWSGSGGGGGGYVGAMISSPSATYAYAVGTGGNAGGAGTSGFAGSAGAAGVIIVEEFYQ